MKFIDEAVIEVIAGNGGDGCLSFRREKYVPHGGPDGGNGGDGGSCFVAGKKGLTTLMDIKYRKHFQAGRGVHGKGKKMHGKRGEDVVIPLPVGTEVWDAKTNKLIVDITEEGKRELIADGGRGGKGNAHFTSSTRQAPRIRQRGEKGETRTVRLELKLLADVGLIGFPNAGKSTLISAISNARPKIADYPFTTKIPHLGVVKMGHEKSFVMADIPGLIEGASDGAGMGIRFLKHIERTRLFLHLIDISDPAFDPISVYRALRKELKNYHAPLLEKPEIVVFTKLDVTEAAKRRDATEVLFQTAGKEVVSISAVKHEGLDRLLKKIADRL